jgi:hypothetical protein
MNKNSRVTKRLLVAGSIANRFARRLEKSLSMLHRFSSWGPIVQLPESMRVKVDVEQCTWSYGVDPFC